MDSMAYLEPKIWGSISHWKVNESSITQSIAGVGLLIDIISILDRALLQSKEDSRIGSY